MPVHFVPVRPEWPPGFLVEAMYPLPHLWLLWLAVGDINTSASDDGTRIPRADRRAPANDQALDGKSLQNAGFSPDTVTVRPSKLWPILP